MDTTCLVNQGLQVQSLASPVFDETKPLPHHHMILAVCRMLNTQTPPPPHTHKQSVPYVYSLFTRSHFVCSETALFSPTLAVFCVLLSYQGNYFSLSKYFIFM